MEVIITKTYKIQMYPRVRKSRIKLAYGEILNKCWLINMANACISTEFFFLFKMIIIIMKINMLTNDIFTKFTKYTYFMMIDIKI